MGEEVDEDEDDESAGDFDPYLFMKHLPPKSAVCREELGRGAPEVASQRYQKTCDAGLGSRRDTSTRRWNRGPTRTSSLTSSCAG